MSEQSEFNQFVFFYHSGWKAHFAIRGKAYLLDSIIRGAKAHLIRVTHYEKGRFCGLP
jgi:hypothetical protein